MMTVNLPAKTLDEGITNMMNTAKIDYQMWCIHSSTDANAISEHSKKELNEWQSKIKIMYGKKFIKVIRENGVFAFVCKDAVSGPFGSFKKGDVLMPASFNRPALNKARGNVLTGNYPIQWTGPLYLK
jgi:hypothetical protein